MHVLVVEDDKKIASFVRKGLEEQGDAVDVCLDGDAGYQHATHKAYDAIVLDIMPRNGFGCRSAGRSVAIT
jgi:DNA-binding response OmpR family regulator